jgi:hypothetical protein
MRAHLRLPLAVAIGIALFATVLSVYAQVADSNKSSGPKTELAGALTAADWERVDRGIEQALAWLAAQQQPDGSFPTRDQGQPGITSLCVMAFLSAGHQPGEGRYGEHINRGIDFALKCQQEDGLICYLVPERAHLHRGTSHTATYNHAITGLMLTEVFGQVGRDRSAKIQAAVNQAIKRTARLQVEPVKSTPVDEGGWRYLYHVAHSPSDSDLSATGWQLMFLRSAKNAQFEIDEQMVNRAVGYIERCFNPDTRQFIYGQVGVDRYTGRGLMGVGALSLALAGKHNTEMAKAAGDWILQNPFNVYGETTAELDRFHYSAYYCTNAMAQLGGKYWKEFFPTMAKTLLDAQTPEGYWPAELGANGEDAAFGPVYPTALSVLTLTPPYQLLPIYQR